MKVSISAVWLSSWFEIHRYKTFTCNFGRFAIASSLFLVAPQTFAFGQLHFFFPSYFYFICFMFCCWLSVIAELCTWLTWFFPLQRLFWQIIWLLEWIFAPLYSLTLHLSVFHAIAYSISSFVAFLKSVIFFCISLRCMYCRVPLGSFVQLWV